MKDFQFSGANILLHQKLFFSKQDFVFKKVLKSCHRFLKNQKLNSCLSFKGG